jgi:DNA-binding SARP family transcriptional activator/tetratricopeptide (TPR) repeat protein
MPMIEVQLLGPPRVAREGRVLSFDTRKATALLAHLCLTESARPRDALADLLWPDADLGHARGALRRTLSTLRGALGADHVDATRDQVRLVRGADLVVDVDTFRARRAEGDLAGALAVWGGELLEGFVVRDAPAFEEWAETTAAALRREVAATLGALAVEREADGDPAAALALVRRWLSLDPLHEPAHQALIRLLAVTGDRAGALVQYRECARTLSRELGVPPLRETTALYEAINEGSFATRPEGPSSPDIALSDDADSSRAAPAAPTPAFVGRGVDVAALLAAFDRVTEHGRVALVEGEAGIGKTRLVEELVARVRQAGSRVAWARGYEDESGLPYRPVVDLLRERAREDPGWLDELDGPVLAEVARLVPDVAAALSPRSLPDPVSPEEPAAEGRFLGALWDAVTRAVTGPAPGVLVVDDAQWADEATLRLLSFGMRRLAGRPVLVVIGWRTPHDHPTRHAASRAAGNGGTALRLGRLDEEAVGELVRSVSAADVDPELVHRYWTTTEGVPLMLVEFLRAGDSGDHLPSGVRGALEARLAPASETARQILSAAAVLGRSFDVDTVRTVSGRSDDETVASLEELVRRGLVREREADYDFDHELLRAVAYDHTSLARRRLLHRRAAAVVPSLAAQARHHELAGRDDAAAEAHRAAGEQARAVFANAEALDHLRRALELGHPDRSGLQTALSDVQVVLGDYGGALVSLRAAAADASPEDLPRLEHRLGRLHVRRGEHLLAEAHLQAALSALPADDLAARASVTADLALAVHSLGEPDRAGRLASEAVALADRAEEGHALCQALNLLGMMAATDGDVAEAITHLHRSRALADELDDGDLQVAALNNLALAHRARGDLTVAVELTEEALATCAHLGDRHREAALHNNLADLLHALGRGDDAMRHLKRAVEIFADVGEGGELQPEIWKLVRW